MNKLNANARVTELDGLSDTIVRLYKDDSAAAKDAFVAATMADVERLSAEITTAILQDKALSTLEAADSERDKAIVALGKALEGYAAHQIFSPRFFADFYQAIFFLPPSACRAHSLPQIFFARQKKARFFSKRIPTFWKRRLSPMPRFFSKTFLPPN